MKSREKTGSKTREYIVNSIEARRAAANETQEDIAGKLGIDTAQWWRMRTGEQKSLGDTMMPGLAKHYPDLYVMLMPLLQQEYDEMFPPKLPTIANAQ